MPDHDLGKIYTVLENCFRFFANNEGITDDEYLWAGDGGFLLLSQTNEPKPDRVLKAAEWFSRYAGHFISSEYLGIHDVDAPVLRVVLSEVSAAAAARISNVAGRMLNVFLKNERRFGKPGFISIVDDAFSQLSSAESKKRFQERGDPVQIGTRTHKVYDMAIHQEIPRLTALILEGKNNIDKTTAYWLRKSILDDRITAIEKIVSETFTPRELFAEIISVTNAALSRGFPGHSFRVAYLREHKGKLVGAYSARPGKEEFKTPIPIDGRYTASLAYREGRPVLVASTRQEKERPENDRRFNLLYGRQDIATLASIACVPIVSMDPFFRTVFLVLQG